MESALDLVFCGRSKETAVSVWYFGWSGEGQHHGGGAEFLGGVDEFSLQRSSTSVRSVITTNVGRSVQKLRATVSKRKVQKNVHPIKKQKFEGKAGLTARME